MRRKNNRRSARQDDRRRGLTVRWFGRVWRVEPPPPTASLSAVTGWDAPSTASTSSGRNLRPPRADVLVMVEDVVGVIPRLHVYQPVVDEVAVRLTDAVGIFIAAEKVDIYACAKSTEGGEESPRPSGVPVAE